MPKSTDDALRKWAVEQAVALIAASPSNEPPQKVEALAKRLVDYVKGN